MIVNAALDAALSYAARGWHVFPCAPREKLPVTKHGWKDASRDPVVIQRWWSEHRDCNVAVATGPSSLVVADFDARHGGLETLAELENEFPMLRSAPRVRTADGFHVWFTGSVKSRATGRPGFELKSQGRYVLAPPSVHPDGPLYAWVRQLDDEPPPQFPGELAVPWKSLNGKQTSWAEKALADEMALLAATRKGERNEQLNKSAFNLGQIVGAGHLDRERVERALLGGAIANGSVDEDGEDAAQATIQSGLNAGIANPRKPKQDVAHGSRRKAGPRPVSATAGVVEPRQPRVEPQYLRGVEPWEEVVAGAVLADEIAKSFRRFIVLPTHADVAVTLWVLHAHAHDAFEISPILAIQSPTKRCGKTRLQQVIAALVPRPMMTSNLTPAVLYRGVDTFQPTLLVDEADSFLKFNEELRGIINSGHNRSSAHVLRCVEPHFNPRAFSTWCPKVIGLIGRLPSTIEDRSVIVPLQRKRRDETVERLRGDRLQHELEPLRRKAARWTQDHFERLAAADPEVPANLNDRAADNWRCLLALADLLGGDWPSAARRAAMALTGAAEGTEETGEQLVADIHTLFAVHGEKLSSEEMVSRLMALPERPWGEWNEGRGFRPRALAALLRGFGIESRNVKFSDGKVLKGYHRAQFEDAFARYLPHTRTPIRYPATNGVNTGRNKDLDSATKAPGSECENAPSTNEHNGGSAVADSNSSTERVMDLGGPPPERVPRPSDLADDVELALERYGWEPVEGVRFPDDTSGNQPPNFAAATKEVKEVRALLQGVLNVG
ncbi:MAG TPA: DUF3631 domain-containing protein [Candidatus Eisenbacteria bacterium]|nr:DUF3631 domain-containing protein [Candidatus Eisenbacteria bacterium]